jgi:hypothetical protein
MMLDWRLRTWLLALYLAALGWFIVFGQSHKLALRGKLFATEEQAANGTFFIDPDTDSESVTISAQGYVRDWLDGTVGRDVVITIETVPR